MYFIRDKFKKITPKTGLIGLDITTSAIKGVVLGSSRSSYQLKHYCIEAIPVVKNNSFVKTSVELAVFIKRMLARIEVPVKECVAALPDTLVNSKWIRIDRSATEDFEVAINLAIEEHIPCPLSSIYFDYQVFEVADQNYLDVFLVACRKTHLDLRLEAIYQANLIPLFIEINSHALERACVCLYPEWSKAPLILIDVDVNQLTFLFLGKTRQIYNYREKANAFMDKATLLKQIRQCISLFCLSYPYVELNKCFLLGANFLLLQDLEKDLGALYDLTIKIVTRNKLMSYAENLNEKTLNELFPNLFLSIGLALRGFNP